MRFGRGEIARRGDGGRDRGVRVLRSLQSARRWKRGEKGTYGVPEEDGGNFTEDVVPWPDPDVCVRRVGEATLSFARLFAHVQREHVA